jgi:hypothetical protein
MRIKFGDDTFGIIILSLKILVVYKMECDKLPAVYTLM